MAQHAMPKVSQRRFPAPVDEAVNGAEEDVVAESIF